MQAPRPQVFTKKDTQQGIKIQTTPIDSAEHREGKADAQAKGVQIPRRHHPGSAGDWAAGRGRKRGGGEGVRMVEERREKEGPLNGRTLGMIGT